MTKLGYARYGNQMRGTSTFYAGFVVVTANPTPHQPGNYSELIASTAFDSHFMDLNVQGSSAGATDTPQLLDLAIGPSFEHIIVPNVGTGHVGGMGTGTGPTAYRTYRIPVYIPQGTRIGARLRALIANDTLDVGLELYSGVLPGGFFSGAGCDALGANTGTSRGVTLTASGTTHQKGGWAVIQASTVNPYRGFVLCPQGTSAIVNTVRWQIDIGVGPDDQNTVVVIPDVTAVGGSVSENIFPHEPGVYLLDTPIPQGSRIVARVQCSQANNADISLSLLGVR